MTEKIYEDANVSVFCIEGCNGKEDRIRRKEALLCECLGISTEDLIIGEHGKPFLPEGYISISHDEEMSVLALSDRLIGVDIEKITKARIKVAEKLFPKDWLIEIDDASEDERPEVFTKRWTGLEAMLKADGRGLALNVKNSPEWIDRWKVKSFVHKDFYVSVAVIKDGSKDAFWKEK